MPQMPLGVLTGRRKEEDDMLEAKHITLSRGSATLLEDASFIIGPGEKVGLVGVNGAGKMTLLRVLHGDLDPGSSGITRPTCIGYLGQERLADALETSQNPDIPATIRNVMLAGVIWPLSARNCALSRPNWSAPPRQPWRPQPYRRLHRLTRLLLRASFRPTSC